VIYCSCPNEVSAAKAAKSLMMLGYRRVRPLLGGLDAWADAGYEIQALAVTESVGMANMSIASGHAR
jgi:rhodanese-related sulfurtransferase